MDSSNSAHSQSPAAFSSNNNILQDPVDHAAKKMSNNTYYVALDKLYKDQGPISDTEPYSRHNEGDDDEDNSTAIKYTSKNFKDVIYIPMLAFLDYHARIDNNLFLECS